MKRVSLLLSVGTLLCSQAWANLQRPTATRDWASYRDMSASTHQQKLNEMKTKGYRPVDVEVLGGSTRTYAVVYRKNTENLPWALHSALNNEQYSQKWNEYKQKGFRPVDQETYKVGSKTFYAGLWIKDGLSFKSNRNLDAATYTQRYNAYRSQGFMPVDVDAHVSGNQVRYSFVWVKNTKNLQWVMQRDIPKSQFATRFRNFSNQGYQLYDTNSYKVGTQQRYATIWVKRSGAWAAYRDMNSQSFANRWAKLRDDGYRIEDIEMYNTSSGRRYAGVWVANNSSRLNWNKKSQVTTAVENFVNGNYMGVSVAIKHRGQTRYLRGFGFADQGKNKQAHSKTIYRLASISKAMSGTLGFALRDRRGFDMEKRIRTFLPGLPTFHTYRTEDLLTNRSGVRHYLSSNDPVNSAGQVANAWAATRLFMNSGLSSQNYLYSTHGYTVFAAAIEADTGRSFCNNLTREISNRHGLPTLRCETTRSGDVNRASLYSVNNSGNIVTTTADNLSWKYAGGGMEASAFDLVNFLDKLDRGQIINRNSVTEMTTRPDSAANYAYGWDVGRTDSKWDWYAKAGAQRGSRTYMRSYPDQDLHIVVLSNTRNGSFASLATQIARIVLN